MTEKLIWISDGFLLTFDKSIKQGEIVITEEKIDIFNSLYTSLSLEIIKVKDLQEYIEQFKKDVEAGKYKGEPGYTPQKGKDYFTQEDIDEIVNKVFEHNKMTTLSNRIKNLEDIEKNNTFIIVEKGEKDAN